MADSSSGDTPARGMRERIRVVLGPSEWGLPNDFTEWIAIIVVAGVGGVLGAWVGGGAGAAVFAAIVVPFFFVLARLRPPQH